jgi:hypothetical protein
MSNAILKPKQEKVFIYGVGIVKRADFNKDHLKKLKEQLAKAGSNVEEYLKKHYEAVGHEDLPLFEDASKLSKAEQKKKDKEAEEAALLKQMEEEEAAKKAKENESDTASE